MTTHTMSGWKTDENYGWFRRTAPDDEGQGAGWEVKLEETDEAKNSNV